MIYLLISLIIILIATGWFSAFLLKKNIWNWVSSQQKPTKKNVSFWEFIEGLKFLSNKKKFLLNSQFKKLDEMEKKWEITSEKKEEMKQIILRESEKIEAIKQTMKETSRK